MWHKHKHKHKTAGQSVNTGSQTTPSATKMAGNAMVDENWQNLSENSQSFMKNRQKTSKINIRRKEHGRMW